MDQTSAEIRLFTQEYYPNEIKDADKYKFRMQECKKQSESCTTFTIKDIAEKLIDQTMISIDIPPKDINLCQEISGILFAKNRIDKNGNMFALWIENA